MRVPVQALSHRLSSLISPLTGFCRPISIDFRIQTFHGRRYHKPCFLKLLPNINCCNIWKFFSTKSDVTFDNQPPSWLFISDAVSGAYGAQVNLDLDLDNRLSGSSLEKLRSDIKLRGMQFDIDELVYNFRKLCVYEKNRNALATERERILAEMKLLKEGDQSENVKRSLQNLFEKLHQIKKELSNTEPFWDLESRVMLSALKLPNDLHDATPATEDLIVREVRGNRDTSVIQGHVEISKKHNLIKFSNVGPKAYYLKGDLVLAEMALVDTACTYLESKKYRHMSGPEVFKTPIMEGCGLNIRNPEEVQTLLNISKDVIEPLSHLAGVSLPTFTAFVAKTCIGDNVIPFNLFACGKCFQNSDLPGLFGAVQLTQATFFSCVKEDDLESQFLQSVDLIWDFLQPLGFPIRLVQISARKLRREERRRFEIQMFVPSLQQFVSVAHVSDLSDFVSRRLMVLHNQNHADIRSASLVHMVSGTLLNITSLLAIWLEYSKTEQDMPFQLCALQFVQRP